MNHDSSFVSGVGYDWDDGRLTMRLGRRTYVYEGVPEPVYQELIKADSLGKAFNTLVKGVYEYREITKRDK